MTEIEEPIEYEVKVPIVLANEWAVSESRDFTFAADIGEIVDQHFYGIYTISIAAEV